PGGRGAALLVEAKFRELGLRNIRRQPFLVPVPETRTAVLQAGDRLFNLASLAPNLVRLSAVPAAGLLNRPLVYAAQGQLSPLRGMDLNDAIVLMDFDTGHRWLDLALLGAAAVVFVEPEQRMTRGEAQRKVLNVPLDLPRFYLDRGSFEAIRASAGASPGQPFTLPGASLAAQADWRIAEAANIIGLLPGSDPELKRECLVVSSYFDSSSMVIERGPGAEQAGGLAALLETIRILSAQRPKRSILFVAFDGHCQALAGARTLAGTLRRAHTRDRWPEALAMMREEDEKRLKRLEGLLAAPRDERLTPEEDAVYRQELARQIEFGRQDMAFAEQFYAEHDFVLQVSLDLSSGSERVGVFHTGHFYANDKLTRFLSPLGKLFEGYATEAGLKSVQDCITPAQEQNWDSWVPDQFATDAEPFTEAARPSISLFTIADARPLVDTPADTPDRVNFGQLMDQVRGVVAALAGAADDPALVTGGLGRLKRMPYRYQPLTGMIYEFERKKTFLPNTPVPHALVVLKSPAIAMMGVRTDLMTMADVRGDFELLGYPDDAALKADAFGVEPGSGRIIYAPDLGPEGETKYPREVKGRQGLRRPLLVFPCNALNLYDLIDERYFETLQQMFIYDARTDSEPRSFGYELPVHSPPARVTGTVSASYVEPVAVVFAPLQTKVKVTMGMGLLGLRMILTNSSPERPEGVGFDPVAQPRLARTSYQIASDMWVIDQSRMERQKVYGISSTRLSELHTKAKEFLDEARTALEARDWERFVAASRAAWAYEARAYPDVQGTEADTIKGVLFYLALLLPFAFFIERLVFGAPRIKEQILWTVSVFLVVYIGLRYVHPAFQLLDTPWIILLGFIISTNSAAQIQTGDTLHFWSVAYVDWQP
ncbi:MAG: M28 family peptidase, partial [Armatimonadetes bacterium]|nr:M28 family peptidase [Armatimonadota bacterium]